MEWLNKLKMNSVKKSIPGFLICVIAAIVLVVLTKCYGVFGMISPKTLAELTPETMDGAFVEDDIYFIYGSYLEIESYRGSRKIGTTGMQYLVDFDDVYYMGLFVHAGRLDEAEEMTDACDKAWDGKISPNDIPIFHVKGMIRAMDSDDLGYYRSATRALDDEELFLPYYLEVDYVNGIPIWGCFAILAAAVFLLCVGIWPLIKAFNGTYQKQVRATLTRDGGSLERAAEEAQHFYDRAPEVSGVRMDKDFVFFQNGPESILLRPWDVAWAYQSTTQHRTNGIPSGKTYAAILRTMDGKQYTLGMKEQKVKELLEAMATALPGVVIGYDKQLEQLYNQNRDAFRQRWAEKRAQQDTAQ